MNVSGDKPKLIECKCPMCKKIHKHKMLSRSFIRPWIYCDNCKGKASNVSDFNETGHSRTTHRPVFFE